MGISTLDQIETLFSNVEVRQIYIKKLAPNQDNDKNQIYLGSGLTGVTNLFPTQLKAGSESESSEKRKSSPRKQKIEAILNFYWLDDKGRQYAAPGAKIIDYFQYPEVRFSGFLRNCKKSPDALRRKKQTVYGQRFLILGANEYGKTYGLVISQLEDPIVAKFPQLPQCDSVPILDTHVIGKKPGSSPTQLITQELQNLAGIWHPSLTLKEKNSIPIPFKGNQGAGYTLEALLNIPRNSSKAPDKHGFEIKSFKKGGKISLMTPTADLGEEGSMSFKDFMDKYGWRGEKKRYSRVFNGIYKFRIPNRGKGYLLEIPGFHPETKQFEEASDLKYVGLVDPAKAILLSGWSFQKFLDSWSKKHASACYVEYESRPYSGSDGQHDKEYRYSGRVYFCTGTTIFLYLFAIASTTVYYDPAHEIDQHGESHQRPQWRISVTRKLEGKLNDLYHQVKSVNLNLQNNS